MVRDFLLLQNIKMGSWGPHNLLFSGEWGSLLRGKAAGAWSSWLTANQCPR